MVAVAACLMAGLDDPAVGILSFVRGLLVAIAAVCLYAFVILPGTDGFPLLTFMLALYLVPAGTLMSMPGWGGTALLCASISPRSSAFRSASPPISPPHSTATWPPSSACCSPPWSRRWCAP